MSQPSPVRGESNGSWLPLIEYSVRSGLSLSTIRRKIKSHTLTYRMENGRYLIFFEGANGGLRPVPFHSMASPSGSLNLFMIAATRSDAKMRNNGSSSDK